MSDNTAVVILGIAFMVFILGCLWIMTAPSRMATIRRSKPPQTPSKGTQGQGQGAATPEVTICSMCGYSQSPGRRTCKHCGAPFLWKWPIEL